MYSFINATWLWHTSSLTSASSSLLFRLPPLPPLVLPLPLGRPRPRPLVGVCMPSPAVCGNGIFESGIVLDDGSDPVKGCNARPLAAAKSV